MTLIKFQGGCGAPEHDSIFFCRSREPAVIGAGSCEEEASESMTARAGAVPGQGGTPGPCLWNSGKTRSVNTPEGSPGAGLFVIEIQWWK